MFARASSSRCFALILGCALALGGCSSKKASAGASSSNVGAKPAASVPAACAPAAESSAPVIAVATTVPPPAIATTNTPAEKRSEPARPRKVLADGNALKVKRLLLATDVKRASREPEGVDTSFKQGEFKKIYAYVEVENPGDESEIVVSFEPPSDKPAAGKVKLGVGTSPRWRTWATTRSLDEKGEWSAVVSTTSGKELAREKFMIL